MFAFSVDASETPDISVRCLVSAKGRSVRKSQTCLRSYLLLAGSSEAYLLLAGSSVKLIFIGWLLLRTACKLCRAEVELEGCTACMTRTDTDSSISIQCGKNMQPCFHLQDKGTVTTASPHFLSFLARHLSLF